MKALIEGMGYTYSMLFAFCYIPQIIKLIKEKTSAGVSKTLYWMCVVAYLLAIVYTLVSVGVNYVLLTNYGSGLIFCSITLFLLYKYQGSWWVPRRASKTLA